jgi:hypothetical protein
MDSISVILSTKTNIKTIHHATEKGGTVMGLCGSLKLPQDIKRMLCMYRVGDSFLQWAINATTNTLLLIIGVKVVRYIQGG